MRKHARDITWILIGATTARTSLSPWIPAGTAHVYAYHGRWYKWTTVLCITHVCNHTIQHACIPSIYLYLLQAKRKKNWESNNTQDDHDDMLLCRKSNGTVCVTIRFIPVPKFASSTPWKRGAVLDRDSCVYFLELQTRRHTMICFFFMKSF
jgi:hypothetical protein